MMSLQLVSSLHLFSELHLFWNLPWISALPSNQIRLTTTSTNREDVGTISSLTGGALANSPRGANGRVFSVVWPGVSTQQVAKQFIAADDPEAAFTKEASNLRTVSLLPILPFPLISLADIKIIL
jgi:hypothetical protein